MATKKKAKAKSKAAAKKAAVKKTAKKVVKLKAEEAGGSCGREQRPAAAVGKAVGRRRAGRSTA